MNTVIIFVIGYFCEFTKGQETAQGCEPRTVVANVSCVPIQRRGPAMP